MANFYEAIEEAHEAVNAGVSQLGTQLVQDVMQHDAALLRAIRAVAEDFSAFRATMTSQVDELTDQIRELRSGGGEDL